VFLAIVIEIQAAITDNNIPIQPDVLRQKLNEFDQVYLQFRKKDWQLSMVILTSAEQKLFSEFL